MSAAPPNYRRSPPNITPMRSGGSMLEPEGGDPELALARVGTGESEQWARIEGRKALVSIVYETGPSGDEAEVEVAVEHLGRLAVGSVILVALVNGDPSNCYLLAFVDVADDGIPDSVCGVQTGAELAAEVDIETPPSVPLPLWQWLKTNPGRLLAIQSGADLLVHAAGLVELKTDEVHVQGRMIVGRGLLTPPTGATVGIEDVDDGEVPGAPATPQPENLIGLPTLPPYAGDQDAVVRAKDAYQSNAAVDPAFFTYQAALDVAYGALADFVAAIATLDPVQIAAGKVIFDAARVVFDAIPKPDRLTSNAMSASQILRAGDSVVGE